MKRTAGLTLLVLVALTTWALLRWSGDDAPPAESDAASDPTAAALRGREIPPEPPDPGSTTPPPAVRNERYQELQRLQVTVLNREDDGPVPGASIQCRFVESLPGVDLPSAGPADVIAAAKGLADADGRLAVVVGGPFVQVIAEKNGLHAEWQGAVPPVVADGPVLYLETDVTLSVRTLDAGGSPRPGTNVGWSWATAPEQEPVPRSPELMLVSGPEGVAMFPHFQVLTRARETQGIPTRGRLFFLLPGLTGTGIEMDAVDYLQEPDTLDLTLPPTGRVMVALARRDGGEVPEPRSVEIVVATANSEVFGYRQTAGIGWSGEKLGPTEYLFEPFCLGAQCNLVVELEAGRIVRSFAGPTMAGQTEYLEVMVPD